jgi:NAD-dependent protein deacetylase/lipoamidase
MDSEALARAVGALGSADRVAVVTGAGVSAESGVATFRGAGGLWEGRRVEEVARPEAFAADPVAVWRFYEQRRENLAKVQPNPAHLVLARWQDRFPDYSLITQNVDGLHEAAGTHDVIRLHGSIWHVRCTACGREREERRVPLPVVPPHCGSCGAIERPAVVWFGEFLPAGATEAAGLAAGRAHVLLVVGTSALVYPAAGLIQIAARAGGRVIEINPEASALAHLADIELRAPAGVVLPELERMLSMETV